MADRPKQPNKRESSARPDPSDDATPVELIVKVHEPNYVPSGVTVRAQISPVLFTCVVPGSELRKLEADPGVHSISVGQRLRTIG
jgi:hypothetical protein